MLQTVKVRFTNIEVAFITVQYPLSVIVLVPTGKMAEGPSLRNFEPVFDILEHLF